MVEATDVTTDLDELKADYTPRQKENFENHMKPKLDRLDGFVKLAEEQGGDPEAAKEFTKAGKKWLIRSYRPKMRGDGLMERDHVQVGQPERYFIKVRKKLGNAYMSTFSLMMEGPYLSDDQRDELETAAVAVFIADHMESPEKALEGAQKLDELEHVAKMYGVGVDDE